MSVSLVWTFRSSSLLNLLLRESQLNVRSTTQRLGKRLKPCVPGVRSTTCAFPIAFGFAPGGQLLPTVSRICPEFFEAWEDWGQTGKQTPSASAIVQIGWSDVDREQ